MNSREQQYVNEKKLRRRILVAMGIVSIVGMLMCGYGHAALSRDLLISGEATISGTPEDFGITYMQEMTSSVCARASGGTKAQLIDQRDGRKYWVSKFYGANSCWMIQDLKLDLFADEDGNMPEFTSLDTDLNADSGYEEEELANGEIVYHWTPSVEMSTVLLTYSLSNKYTLYSFNFGEYVRKNPDYSSTACDYNKTKGKGLAGCNTQLVSVEGWGDSLNYEKTGVSYDAETETYDGRYLIGNYYLWGMAAAESLEIVQANNNKVAPSSLCPKGWRLPNSEYELRNTYNSIENIYLELGITPSAKKEPLYGSMGGYVDYGGTIRYVWQYSYYWSSRFVAPGTGSGFTRLLNAGAQTPVGSTYAASYGLNIRCVAR